VVAGERDLDPSFIVRACVAAALTSCRAAVRNKEHDFGGLWLMTVGITRTVTTAATGCVIDLLPRPVLSAAIWHLSI